MIFEWTKLLGSSFSEKGNALTTGADASIYIAGTTRSDLDGQTHSGYEDAFIEKFDIQGAIDEYSIAMDIDPNDIDALFFKGRAKNKLGKSLDSANDLRQVIKLDRQYQMDTSI